MNEHYLRNVIEAALLAAGRPVQPAELIQLFDESVRPAMEQLRAALDELAAEYAARGIELKETASGVRIQVRRELAGEVSRLWPERPARYSRALLETLALIAYRQPITRGEIEAVRGVAVNPNIVKTLLERNWVRVVGTRDVPGRPELLGTTRDFLDYFGLKSLDELPPLSELKAVGDINLQLDLQGEPSQPAPAGGEAPADATAGDAPAAAEACDGAEAAAETAAASAQAVAEPDALALDTEPQSDEALLEAGERITETDNTDAGNIAADNTAVDNTAERDNTVEVDAAAEDDEDGEDGGEDGELSAEGGDSHELVAAPRDNGD